MRSFIGIANRDLEWALAWGSHFNPDKNPEKKSFLGTWDTNSYNTMTSNMSQMIGSSQRFSVLDNV